MAPTVSRRGWLEAMGMGLLLAPGYRVRAASPFPVRFRKPAPYESLVPYAMPGHDAFAGERAAMEEEGWLKRMVETGEVRTAAGFEGESPMPVSYRPVSGTASLAEYASGSMDFQKGLQAWRAALGRVRELRLYALSGQRVRYEIASDADGGLTYRVGIWRVEWRDGALARLQPLEESLVRVPRPLFRDVTAALFEGCTSFREQLLDGVPYWRGRLDSASGIDIYGNNGIAVGDIDGDGFDEVYVCQPGGLPNRLYRHGGRGVMEDISEQAGVDVLDDTASALLVDLRNRGRPDLVVLTTSGPLLFLNDGAGRFTFRREAFRSAKSPQGTFTGMAAADYDRDGRLDLYLCTYIYFQSEDQYRYPSPYHDARHGPSNFLFRNRLEADGSGYFEDVTDAVGLGENNNRFSFAAAWCDYDGDGWPDLYVANDFGGNNLYRNEGGKFRDVAEQAGVLDLGPGMSAAWFDYDGDGRPDLYVSNMWTASGQRVVEDPGFAPVVKDGLREAYHRHTKGNSLYRNTGAGGFAEVGASEGVEMGRWAWAADAADFDNDGSPEIYIGAGMLTNTSRDDLMSFFWRQVVAKSPPVKQAADGYENGWNAINQMIREEYSWNGHEPNVFYAREGGRYFDYSGVSGLGFIGDTRAFAITDLDGDGNPDVVAKNRLGPQVRLFLNESFGGRHSLAVDLVGVKSNRDAIGARVEVEHNGRKLVRWVSAGSGYLSQHTKRLHFGLGEAREAERIRVTWLSGTTQEFSNWKTGHLYRVTEGSPEAKASPFRRKDIPARELPAPPRNQPAEEDTWLLEPVPLPETRRGPGFVFLVAEDFSAPAAVPCEVVDLRQEGEEIAAAYALFRRYLFDYRTGLKLPLVLLIDADSRAHKIYFGIPPESSLRRDLAALSRPDPAARALPFGGRYYHEASRNYFRLGAAFFYAGDPARALPYFEEVLRRNPENTKALLAVGQIQLDAGKPREARAALERALRLNPAAAEGWNNLGGVALAEGNDRAALEHFEKAIEIQPDSLFALANAAQVHARLGNAGPAEKLLRRVLEIDGKDADAANQLGLLLAKSGRYEEAKKWLQQAITVRRDHAGAINNLGVLYMQMQQPQDALSAFQYGISVAPDDETLYLNLARVYVGRGERETARDVLRRLQVRKPESEMARRALQQLGEW